jgi:Mor family transcriptional regulator
MCVNPRHLFIGTWADNHADMIHKGRQREASPGESHPNAKLNDEAIRQIRAAHNSGAGYARLGRRFGVTRQAIYCIVKRGGWSHVAA